MPGWRPREAWCASSNSPIRWFRPAYTDAPAGTALVLANFTYRPIEGLTVRVPLAKPVRVVRSVEQGPLRFTEERPSPSLRVQRYSSVAVFRTRLGLNGIIPLE